MSKHLLLDLSFDICEKLFAKLKLKNFIVKQVFHWIYQKNIYDFNKMTNISLNNQKIIKQNFAIILAKIIDINIDKKHETFKFLVQFHDKNSIEMVVMKFGYGWTICLSSQVGCSMQCKFCASGMKIKKRDLTPGEFVMQYLLAKKYIFDHFHERITNIVIMGIGEPFDNFTNLVEALKIITNPYGMAIGPNHITVSTCGICPKILQLAKLMPKINLAVSLHAPNDAIRKQLMPINNAYNLNLLLRTCKKYCHLTKKRITFEYILLENINDHKTDAIELIKKLKGINCYVNLIPYNEINECKFARSKKINIFFSTLKQNKILVKIRQERGGTINAACGQLRIKYEDDRK